MSNIITYTKQAQEIAQIEQDIKRALKRLSRNINEYNNITQQLQNPTTCNIWIEQFKQRRRKAQNIVKQNHKSFNQIINLSRKYYEQDIEDYRNDLRYTDLKALSKTNITFSLIYNLCEMSFNNKEYKSLPFFMEQMCRSYEKDIVGRMPQSEVALALYGGLMDSMYQIAMFGDVDTMRQMVYYAHKVLEFVDRYDSLSSDFLRMHILCAFRNLVFMGYICEGGITPEQAFAAWEQYKVFKAQHPKGLGIDDKKLSENMSYVVLYIETFIPIYALVYHQLFEDKHNETWLQNELKEFVANYKQPTPYTYRLFVIAKWALGEWTANEAFENGVRYFHSTGWKPHCQRTVQETTLFIYMVKSMVFLLSRTNYVYEVKKAHILRAIELIIGEIKFCRNKQYDFEFTRVTCDVLQDANVNIYLSTVERNSIINDLFCSTQVHTHSHNHMVSRVCEEILDGVIQYNPSLLVGVLRCMDTNAVVNQANTLVDYITNASRLCEIGKFWMIQVVRNQYMSHSLHEVAILQQHSTIGAKYLGEDPAFAQYSDVALYHHKWYDGSFGYPKGDDNTRSPYRIFTDIIYIAKSLIKGTDKLVGSYEKSRSFESNYKMMLPWAGTQYNPYIMDLIGQHKDIFQNLSKVVRTGWDYNYYETYLDYFEER